MVVFTFSMEDRKAEGGLCSSPYHCVGRKSLVFRLELNYGPIMQTIHAACLRLCWPFVERIPFILLKPHWPIAELCRGCVLYLSSQLCCAKVLTHLTYG